MSKPITITETERAANVAFQIKQLLVNLQEQVKPQLINGITLMEHGTAGLSKDALNKALGEEAPKVLEAVKTIANAI